MGSNLRGISRVYIADKPKFYSGKYFEGGVKLLIVEF